MRLFMFLSTFFFFSVSYTQQPSHSQITIIGTTHNGNNYINGDSLLNILYKINPAIIFDEIIFSVEAPLYVRLAKSLGLKKNTIEDYATKKYVKKYPNTLLVGMDMKFENRNKYAKEVQRFNENLKSKNNLIFASSTTPDSIKQIILQYITPKNYSIRALNNSDLYTLNQLSLTDSIRLMYKILNTRLISAINNYPQYSDIVEMSNEYLATWNKRNNVMAKNILNQIQTVSTISPVVILCGLYHKFYLEDLLKPQQDKYNFKLYNYWELFKEQ
ncbi:MAG: hypothetical protein EAZ13_02790 [Sphingobacteriia bacterium]|nr:MAG: hypothetical protein EAZ13_02790 [Sphingobacteriia bacterium]